MSSTDLRYNGEAGRFHDGASSEGIPETKDAQQGSDPYMPVAVSPSQLDFYIDEQGGDTQVLTLFNVNEHPVHFQLMSNAPKRYSVTGRSGIITPHCYADIVVHHCDLSEENVGIRDNLRIVMREQGSRIQGFRDVPVILWSRRSISDDENEKEDEEDVSQIGSSRAQPLPEQDRNKGWAPSGHESLVLFVVIACVVVLMLPLEGARDTRSHSLFAHFPLSHEHKLFAAYILGLMTTLIVR